MESIRRVFPYCLFGGCRVRRAILNPILLIEVARWCIDEVRGVVQVLINWFRGITNLSRSSKLGLVARILSDE